MRLWGSHQDTNRNSVGEDQDKLIKTLEGWGSQAKPDLLRWISERERCPRQSIWSWWECSDVWAGWRSWGLAGWDSLHVSRHSLIHSLVNLSVSFLSLRSPSSRKKCYLQHFSRDSRLAKLKGFHSHFPKHQGTVHSPRSLQGGVGPKMMWQFLWMRGRRACDPVEKHWAWGQAPVLCALEWVTLPFRVGVCGCAFI